MRHGARVFNTSQFPKLIMCPYNIIVLSIFHCCFSPVHLQEGRYLQSITKETLSVSRRMMALENKVDQVDEFGIDSIRNEKKNGHTVFCSFCNELV